MTLRACVAAAMVLAFAPPAWADDDEREPTAVGVFVVPAEGATLASARRATLLLTMEEALRQDRRLDVVDKDWLLAERQGHIPEDVISEARGLLVSANAMLHQGKVEAALARLEAAERQLSARLAFVPKRALARTQYLIGAAHAMLGRDERARAAFVRLLVWRPGYTADFELAPDTVVPVFEEARKQRAALPGGSVELVSDPSGALVYVDGELHGFTPTTAEGLVAGTHYVTFEKVGYVRAVLPVEVSRKRQRRARAELTRAPEIDRVEAAADAIGAHLGEAHAPAEMEVIAELLGVRHAVFVRVPAVGGDAGGDDRFEAFVYDVASRERLAAATVPASAELEPVFAELARTLYGEIVLVPVKEPLPPPDPITGTGDRKRPFWKTWWFWTGVATVAVTATAVPLITRDDGPSGPRCPSGNVCGDVIFRF